MKNLTTKFLFLIAITTTTTTTLVLLLTPAAMAVQLRPSGGCVPGERDALLAFKKGITEDQGGFLTSWREDHDCCRWRGVRCSNRTGHVHVLELSIRATMIAIDDGLPYDTPTDDDVSSYNLIGLVGNISHSLLSLHHLQHLDLSYNSLEGCTGFMPKFLGSLKKLRYLNLSGIPFHGSVPPHLGNLSNLQVLDISDTENSYSADISWVTRLPQLRFLNMRGSKLSSVVDWAHVFNMVSSLRVLDLSDCDLATPNQWLLHLNLTNLEELHLSNNDFNHPIASCWFWNVKSLKYLDLRSTYLYGKIPDAIGNLTSLKVLDFSLLFNPFLYDHPGGIMQANMTNLCNLRILDLTSSLSHGNIAEVLEGLPWCASNKLNELHLGSNNISGKLPDWIGKFASIVKLDLSDNHLTGAVPSEIGMLTNLNTIWLSGNSLDGLITKEHFTSLASLKDIRLSGNSLKIVFDLEWLPPFRLTHGYFSSCQLGPLFPVWLQSQVDIVALDISSTDIIDVLPNWFWTTFSESVYLNIGNNTIRAKLPANMETMSVKYLFMNSNNFSGGIPQFPRNLYEMDVSRNSLSGPLPQNIGAQSLVCLNLSFNNFTGHIPASFCGLFFIKLSLDHNSFDGELPQCLSVLYVATLSNNKFSGKFPSFLQKCTSLEILDLSRNKFTGRLPMWLGDLTMLLFLKLSNNMFSGNIPLGIWNLGNLYVLDIAGNNFSGALPLSLSNLTTMTTYNHPIYVVPDASNIISKDPYVPVVTKHQELYYDYRSSIGEISIDLSSNHLSGVVPEGIVYLDALQNLNLSWNFLSGEIPEKLGIIQSLQSLDVSRNMLSGEIPQSLSNLTSLSYLDLSYNNLTGVIPSGSQLESLYSEYPDIYSGNDGLCGPPLRKNCSSGRASQQGHLRRNNGQDHELEPFYFGLVLGFILGLWAVFCILLFKKTWRVAYFHLYDKLYDKAYVLVAVTWARFTRNTTTN